MIRECRRRRLEKTFLSKSMMLSAYIKPNTIRSSSSSSSSSKNDLHANYELRRCPIPKIEGKPPGTVLIRTIATSICGSDLFGLGGCPCCPKWRRPTALLDAMPEISGGSGHEALGVIVDMIPTTSHEFSTGQRVLAMSTLYMYKVASLKDVIEEETGCDIKSAYPDQCGAFCEYFVSHVSTCVKIPDTIPSLDFDYRWYWEPFYMHVKSSDL